jgi:hypothetical protein
VRLAGTGDFGDTVFDFDVTGTGTQVDKVQFTDTLKAAYDDIASNGLFAWGTGNGANVGNTTVNLNTTVETLFLAGSNGEGVTNANLRSASAVATEFNAEFNITASAGQDALLVVNDTNANSFAVWRYTESGASPEIQSGELLFVGLFNANGAVSTSQLLLV